MNISNRNSRINIGTEDRYSDLFTMLEDMQNAEIATRCQQDTKPVTTVPEGHASLLTTCMIYWARSSVTWWIVVMPNAFE